MSMSLCMSLPFSPPTYQDQIFLLRGCANYGSTMSAVQCSSLGKSFLAHHRLLKVHNENDTVPVTVYNLAGHYSQRKTQTVLEVKQCYLFILRGHRSVPRIRMRSWGRLLVHSTNTVECLPYAEYTLNKTPCFFSHRIYILTEE